MTKVQALLMLILVLAFGGMCSLASYQKGKMSVRKEIKSQYFFGESADMLRGWKIDLPEEITEAKAGERTPAIIFKKPKDNVLNEDVIYIYFDN